ncbi:MAG: PDZ domain-containing protein [Gammaproteobacteria bacterium]|nr:PDZ domain-containing protein [Gammaproteobacteria bacterium]
MNIKSVAAVLLSLALFTGIAQAQAPNDELREAREQLEAAARRIAELSAGAVQPVIDFTRSFGVMERRAVLGIGIEDDENGVRVVGVTPGGGADEAGIQTGDIVTAMDGAELVSGNGGSASEVLIAQMGNVDPGDTVVLTVVRDGESSDVEIEAQAPRAHAYAFGRPGGAPDQAMRVGPFGFNMPFQRWPGMELVELTPALGAYFGTDTGLLVVRAPRDGMLGLQDGDVILEISGRSPMDVGHALRILRSFEPGERLELTIMRNQRRETLEVDLPRGENEN